MLEIERDKIVGIVKKIIEDIAPDEDLSEIKYSERLRDQFNLDSMDFLDIVMELRKRYGVEVPEPDYFELRSLESCVNYLLPKFKERKLL
jgi:acyl carrier protein